MTTRQKFEQMLFERGVFESQAKAIMDFAIPKIDEKMEAEKTKKLTWHLPADGYPNRLYAIAFMIYIKPLVVEWIDANLPLAWYRPMFAETLEPVAQS